MNNEQIIQEATEAVEKNLNAGCYVEELLRIVKEQQAEIISITEEYNDMLEQRNKVEEALEIKTMDVNSLTSERDALQEMVAEQQAEIDRQVKAIQEGYKLSKKQQEEIVGLSELLDRYEASARSISLRLAEFCNTNLPYDVMIADASRRVYAEIERLKESNKRLSGQMGSLIYHLETAKTEAYREFADKLVDAFNKDINLYGRCTVHDVALKINNTLNELTESNE